MATESVRVICPNLKCRAILSAPGQARGKNVRCRMCGSKVRVPTTMGIRPKAPENADATEPAEA